MSRQIRIISAVTALCLVVGACSSGSDTQAGSSIARTKNAALPATTVVDATATTIAGATATTVPGTTATTVADATATTVPVATATTIPGTTATTNPGAKSDSNKTKVSASASVDIAETIVVPSKLCKLMGLNCDALDFAEVTVSSPTSFVATAAIPTSSIKLPSGDGYGFKVLTTELEVATDGSSYEYGILADIELVLGGSRLPLSLVGQFVPSDATVAIEMSNNNVGLKNAMGIPGFDITSLTAKNTYVGGVPKGVGFAVSGKIPNFLKELGVNPNTPFTAAIEFGVGVTVGMGLGSRNGGSPDIVSIQNVLSAKYMQASFSTVGATIAGVEYRKGLHLVFDGMFGKTPVFVDGSIAPSERIIEFEIGSFDLAGFKFDESKGKLVWTPQDVELGFSGGLAGYGISGRMAGSFDTVGGISLKGDGGFKPGGVDLGSLKLDFVANKDGVKFIGTGSQKFGVMAGETTVGFKSFPNNKFGFEMGVGGGLQIPGAPEFASVDGKLSITNCPAMTCAAPTDIPVASIIGSASFYKQPRQQFTLKVDPNNWGFREELKFNFNENQSYESNGFMVFVKASGTGSITISDKGISLGQGNLSASAGFKTPDVNVPKQTVVVTETRLPRTKTTCSYWPRTRVIKKCNTWTEYYTNRAGGETISEAFTIKGIEVALGASVGIDAKGFYIEVQPGKDVKGARLYFKN